MSEWDKDKQNPNEETKNLEPEAVETDKPDETVQPSEGDALPAVPEEAAEEAAAAPSPASAPQSRIGTVFPWVVAVIAVAALAFVLIRGTGGSDMNEAVGKMDGVTITKADYYEAMIKQMGSEAAISNLDTVMTLKLLDLEAEKAGAVISEADIDAEVSEIKKSYPSEEVFEQSIAQQGMTLETIREQVRTQLKLRKIFDPKINPKEDDLKAFFEENKANFSKEEEVRASHILVEKKEDAEAILKELKEGAEFAKLASEKSTDTGSAAKGGDLDWFGRGVMNEPFETAAFKLKKGELSGVVESPNGFHIILVTDKIEASSPTYDDVKQQVRNRYVDQNSQALISDWLTKAKEERHYDNLLDKKSDDSATASPAASASAQ